MRFASRTAGTLGPIGPCWFCRRARTGLDVDGADEDLRQVRVGCSVSSRSTCPQRIRSFDRCMDTRRIISNYLQRAA